MSERKSIEIPGFSHANPIPGASRVGNLMMSSIITGRDPGGREMPESVEQQITNIFSFLRAAMDAAGGSPEDIVKISFWMEDPASGRLLLNDEWQKMFPNPDSRPARHTHRLPGGGASKVTCEFTAVLNEF